MGFPFTFFPLHGNKNDWGIRRRQFQHVRALKSSVKVFLSLLPHIRWKPAYQWSFLKLFTSPCVFMICTSLLACSPSNAVMLLTRDSFSFRSGEWTHTDWLCHCVKGYPVSCRLTLPLPPDSRSRKSWISHLCLTLCLCVWIQETSDSLKSLDSITRTNNILTFLWSLWVMTWSEGIWRWISFFYLTYFIFAFLFLFLRGERTSLSWDWGLCDYVYIIIQSTH